MAIGLDHWFIVGVSNIIHVDPGPTVALMTVVAIFGIFMLLQLLALIFVEIVGQYEKSTGFGKFLWWLVMVSLGVFLFIVDLLLTIGAGLALLSLLATARDWWHKGS